MTDIERRINKAAYDKVYSAANKVRKAANHRAYYVANREKLLLSDAKWARENPEKKNESLRRQNLAHPGRMKKYDKRWRLANPEKVREKNERWRLTHPGEGRLWKLANPDNVIASARKQTAKRRVLGFHSLNSYFVGSEGHHINNDDVIFIPKALHRSISHNQFTGRNMAAMNALAGKYLTEDWT